MNQTELEFTKNSQKRLVGRRAEQATLRQILLSDKAEFLAIYGRRRVGKTFLVRRFFEDTSAGVFYVSGQSKGTLAIQLANFQKSVEETFYDGLRLPRLRQWSEAFDTLLVGLKKKIHQDPTKRWLLFIDELPWLTTPKSRLIEALDHAWNTQLSWMPAVKLVICGSAASWMIKNIVNAKGGLHNRLTEIIHLKPFTLAETRELLEANGVGYEIPQVLELYLAFGGIPFYLSLVRRGESPSMAISRLCFGGGTLQMEFKTLFQALFDSGDHHEKIIRGIGSKHCGLSRSEILETTGIASGGRFEIWLRELTESGFIAPIECAEGKRMVTYYRVIDEFVLFHLKWIEPTNKGLLGPVPQENHFFLQKATAPFEAWAGFAFEGICFKHIPQIKKALGIQHIRTDARSWQKRAVNSTKTGTPKIKKRLSVPNDKENITANSGRGAQIDLLFDRDDGIITLCEIKYNKDPYVVTKDYAAVLENKMQVYKTFTLTKKSLFLAMITAGGLADNPHARRLVTNSITAVDLFTSV